jgi:hypothetical protein
VTEAQPGGGPTVRRMLVGSQPRRLRTQRGLTREQAGEAIRTSEWKIHRLENGQVGFKERDLVDLLDLYGVSDAVEVASLITLAREADQPGWWQHYGDVLAAWFRAYVDLESALQVILMRDGAHPAMGGAFSILRFADAELPDVVHVEHLTNALYLDKREDVERYLHVMESISVRSQAPDRTAEILDELLREA